MYRVLLVDDEPSIVRGLELLVRWGELGFKIVGKALNGQQGLEMAKKTNPDIVITDIRMPMMDGYEMMEQIKSAKPETFFFILSGYREFEYAQKAVEQDVCSYLLKPVRPEVLTEKLLEIQKRLDARKTRKEEFARLQEKFQKSKPIILDNTLLLLSIRQNNPEKLKIEERWRFLDTPYLLTDFCHAVIDCRSIGKSFGGEGGLLLASFAVRNIVEELLEAQRAGMAFSDLQAGQLCVLFCSSTESRLTEDKIVVTVAKIHSSIQQALGVPVCIAYGHIHRRVEEFSLSYSEAQKAFQYRLLFGEENTICVDEIESLGRQSEESVDQTSQVLDLMELGEIEQAVSVFAEWFDLEIRRAPPEKIYGFCVTFSVRINVRAIACGCETDQYTSIYALINDLPKLKTIEIIKNFLLHKLRETSEKIRMKRSQKTDSIVFLVKEYIDANFAQPLSLDFLSKKFFINPSYLSQVFKKETGYRFLDYLTMCRMEFAKRLLVHTDRKIYEVCEAAGYNDKPYFSKLFEKYTGFSPSDFRQNHQKNT